jgi:tetratricopeptide (TPR) repeat protein
LTGEVEVSGSAEKKPQGKKRQPPARRMPEINAKPATLIIGVMLVVATVMVYAQAAGHDFITVDDGLYVSRNGHVLAGPTAAGIRWAFTTTSTGNWHPLTWMSLMADTWISGPSPAGYHVTNLILHVLNVLLVFLLLQKLTGSLARSAVVAALFALHPLHVESVAWISERKDVLSTLFWLLGIWAYLRYCRKPAVGRYVVAACAFVLGLMAKPMPVSFPFTLLLLDIWPLRRVSAGNRTFRTFVRLAMEKAPLFLISFASSILTFWAQKTGGAVAALDQLPIHLRVANALISYIAYLGKLLWPADLALFYPLRADRLPSWEIALCAIAFAVMMVYAVRAFDRRPYVTFGWLWYVITLLPVIGLVQIGSQALADRYSYVPSLGIFVIMVWGVSDLLARIRDAHPAALRRWSWAPAAAACGLLLILAVLANRQAQFWKDDITVWEHAAAVTPPNYFSHYNLARAYDTQHRYDEALAHNRACIRIDPNREEAYNNLAVLLMGRRSYDEAESALLSALRINPQFTQARSNMSMVLCKMQRYDEGFRSYQEAMRLDPQNTEIRRNFAACHCDYGMALAGKNHLEEAVAEFQSALSVAPEFSQAHYNLGLTYAELRRPDAAKSEYEKAIAADPANAEAHNNLGVLLAETGKIGDAIEHFRAALRIRPDYQDAANNLRISSAGRGNSR